MGGKAGKGNKRSKRYTWSDELHRRFLIGIFDIGLKQARAKAVHELMTPAPAGMTPENIEAHLAKYRNNTEKARARFLRQFDMAYKLAVAKREGKPAHPHTFAHTARCG